MAAAKPPLQVLREIAQDSESCNVTFLLDLEDGRKFAFYLGRKAPPNAVATFEAGVRFHRGDGYVFLHELAGPDMAAAIRKFVAKYPRSELKPGLHASLTNGPVTQLQLKYVAQQAWAEANGQPIPAEDELARMHEEELAADGARVIGNVARIASGPEGIREHNAISMWERISFDFKKANLAGLNLDGVKFGCANLEGADLTGSSLREAAFGEMGNSGSFTKVKFIGSDLTGADLHNSRANGSDFSRANLTGVKADCCTFARCKLVDAILDQADLHDADLTGADLTGASVVGTRFSKVRFDDKTRWPAGFLPPMDAIFKGKGADPRLVPTAEEQRAPKPTDLAGFLDQIKKVCDASRVEKALGMLKADRFRLFARVDAAQVIGIVKSQSDAALIYSCRLGADGKYACCTQNLNICGGLRGAPCKHLLVMILGLAQAGELDWGLAHDWVQISRARKPALDKEAMAEALLQYRGAETGELEWRPTETIPEDFYAL